MPGHFPAVVFFLSVPQHRMDVNVHPSKTEIRFLDSSKIFSAVEGTFQKLLNTYGSFATARSTFSQYSNQTYLNKPESSFSVLEESQFESSQSSPRTLFQTESEPYTPKYAEPLPFERSHPLDGARTVGTLFKTYILFDLGNELALIDQHAAHERVRFEALRSKFVKGKIPESQAMLIPEAIHIPDGMEKVIEKRLCLLNPLGFEVEIFGDTTVLFRSIPSIWGTSNLKIRLKNLIQTLINYEPSQTLEVMDESLFEKLASESCHSSIRGGDDLEAQEISQLVTQLFSCEHPWNCPHGRPTLVKIPRSRFDDWFLRKI